MPVLVSAWPSTQLGFEFQPLPHIVASPVSRPHVALVSHALPLRNSEQSMDKKLLCHHCGSPAESRWPWGLKFLHAGDQYHLPATLTFWAQKDSYVTEISNH